MNLFYAPSLTIENEDYVFDKSESKHISRVLRKRNGDTLHITNGLGDLFKVEIVDNNPNKTSVKIIEKQHFDRPATHIHMAIAPTKSNERFEWFLEKAVEIGVSEITPLLTKHSERKKINIDRYERIIIAAMKQSLQFYKPILHPLTPWKKFISKPHKGKKMIAYCRADKNIKEVLSNDHSFLLAIGPEGGFSPIEIEESKQAGFQPVGLSKNRLRTETAGIVGLTAIHFCRKN
jgi:16S rRNA (uracil1498-N3)-methyltransferase